MGTVYLASRSDGQFDQKVAIKVVKRGMDSEEILRRFAAERRTLAALDHPNIARLLDGGVTPDARPFLVMEYVDGTPIDTYCDRNRLKVRERLALFRDVCAGVHHAHQHLVIHRDLKPSNILVTAAGVPKLLDFGIAKVLSGSDTDPPSPRSVTSETERRLTPEYASPEQIDGGPVTTATDVYSLGVVLYELLTGTRPYHFGVRTTEELRRVICTLVPPAPSAAITVKVSRLRGTSGVLNSSPGVHTPPGTLNAAPAESAQPAGVDVPKTRGVSSTRLRNQLRGDLDNVILMALRKGYGSAEQFAADVGHYLAGMPVQARRDTLAYRASKFVRRHAFTVTLSAAAVTLLTTASIILYRQAQQLTIQRDELAASNRVLTETRRYLMAVIGGAETANQGPDAKLGTVLRDAAQALKSTPPTDPLTRAAAEQAIGRSQMSLGMLADARPLLESAERGLAALPEVSDTYLDLQVDLAELLFFEGKHAQAEARFRELLASERARAGNAHTEREGRLLSNLGASLRLQSKTDEAIATQREAIASRAALEGDASLAVAESRNNLASALFQKGDLPAAIEEFERTIAARRALLRPDHPLIVRAQSNLGLAELRADHPDRAVEILTAAAQAWDKAFGPDHPGRIQTITSLSQALRQQGKQPEAISWLRRALDWQTEHQPKDAPQIAATESKIAVALAEMHQDAQARATLERVLPALKAPGAATPAVLRAAREALLGIYERAGDTQAAQALKRELDIAK